MPVMRVLDLKAGMTVGNERRWLYTVMRDAQPHPDGTVTAPIAFYENGQIVREETRRWLHGGEAQVHVR